MENKITHCIDCESHQILPDPDPNDWFCDDDIKIVCSINNKQITCACRPYNARKESQVPTWCPKSNKKKATSVLVYDKDNKQEDYQFIAEDSNDVSHIGYVYVEKPWYSPQSEWKYYIRTEEYKGGGFCGGASSSGFVDILVDGDTIRPWNQIEKIKHDLKMDFNVKIVESYLIDSDESIALIHSEDEIPYTLWEK